MNRREWLLKMFGAAIRDRRTQLGLSQMKLAELVECSLQHIGNVERGESNTSFIMMYKIADVLKIHPRELIP